MKKYKFRVWDKVDKIMYTPSIIPNPWNGENQNHEIMRYIELNDKNGKEIYEGDIYKYENSNYGYGNPNTLEYITKTISSITELYGDEFLVFDLTHGEVIGNIYHNPELLK